MPSVGLRACFARRGAAQQHHQVGMFGAADPDLLAVDDISVALAPGESADARRVGAAGRFGDAEGLQAQLAAGDPRQIVRFCAALPCRSIVPIVYICAWQAAPLQPERWISSRIAVAAPSPRPEPPYSSGIRTERKPSSRQRSTNACGIGALAVERAPIFAGKSRQSFARHREFRHARARIFRSRLLVDSLVFPAFSRSPNPSAFSLTLGAAGSFPLCAKQRYRIRRLGHRVDFPWT